jgi:hypothetical protein
MLQIDVQPYASDALEDAMRLAQTKALNSYTFSDMLNYLNYAWMDMYQKLAQQDEGYYSRTVKLTSLITKLPPFVKNTVRVYSAQRPVGFNREIFRASGYNDLQGISTYHISGFDLYCPDAVRRTVWLNYVPMQQQIFFTKDNRDPKIIKEPDPNPYPVVSNNYNLYNLTVVDNVYTLAPKNSANPNYIPIDITDTILWKGPEWAVVYISCAFPYIFVSYKHTITDEYYSGFFRDVTNNSEFIEYNPFAYTGHNSNVEYLKCAWNDKTGMGVVIRDHNNDGIIKELGWTPDTKLTYPAPEMYRLLVARLADKFSALNESNVMGVQKELVEAEYAFNNFIRKDKSSWQRIDNVNGPTIGYML